MAYLTTQLRHLHIPLKSVVMSDPSRSDHVIQKHCDSEMSNPARSDHVIQKHCDSERSNPSRSDHTQKHCDSERLNPSRSDHVTQKTSQSDERRKTRSKSPLTDDFASGERPSKTLQRRGTTLYSATKTRNGPQQHHEDAARRQRPPRATKGRQGVI